MAVRPRSPAVVVSTNAVLTWYSTAFAAAAAKAATCSVPVTFVVSRLPSVRLKSVTAAQWMTASTLAASSA